MKKIVILGLVLFSCLSCKTLLTTSIKARIKAAEIDIEKVQFYNTKTIVLFRELNSNKGEAQNGKVKFMNGKYYEFVKIKKNTPCICVKDSTNNLEVSFEETGTLKFGNQLHRFYLKNDNDYYITDANTGIVHNFPFYQIYAGTWSVGRHFNTSYSEISDSPVGQVNYGDSTYLIVKGKTAKLALKKKQLDNLESKKRVVKGIKVQ
jgi:hypothetical protein